VAGCVHNDEYECSTCTDARHDAAHPELVPGCMACKLSTIQVGERVVSRRTGGKPAGSSNSWERGIVHDHRGVPLWDGRGDPIGVKQYANNRSSFDEARRRLATHPEPFAPERK
jgi:hypothetical protein